MFFGVVAIFFETILHGRTPRIRGDGGQTRDYVYVMDLVRAAAAAIQTDKSGVWNLGTGIETSVNELFDKIARVTEFKATPEKAPLGAGEQRRSVLDGTRVRRDFNLPDWTRLDEGLQGTAEYFREKVRAEKAGVTAGSKG